MRRTWANSRAVTIAMAAGLAALFAVNVYRAATQSITYDEAVAYLFFAAGSFGRVFSGFHPGNHLIFTVLSWLSTAAFGVSEFTLRLPVVLSGGVYFVACLTFAVVTFKGSLLRAIAVAVMTLNPYVLDFLVAARGYGMALAAFVVAWYQLTRAAIDDEFTRWRWAAASVALGVALAAQLAFLFPVVTLAASSLAVVVLRERAQPRARSSLIPDALMWLTIPGAIVAAAIIGVPLSQARRSQFEFGAWAVAETVRSLVDGSFRHHVALWPRLLTVGDERIVNWLIAAAVTASAAAVIGTVWSIAARFRARDAALVPHEGVVLTGVGTIALTLLIVFVARTAFNLKYPLARTALYFLPLVSLTVTAAAQSLVTQSGTARVAGGALVVGLAVAAVRFAIELQTTHFYEWRFDAGSRRVYETIAGWPNRPPAGWRVGTDDLYPPALNFYRETRKDGAIQEVTWDWDGMNTDFVLGAGADYDFFVVRSGPAADRLMTTADAVYRDPISNAVVFVRRPRAHP